MDATLEQAEAFPAKFETMIAAPGTAAEGKALREVITSLEEQGSDLSKAAEALGVTVNFEA